MGRFDKAILNALCNLELTAGNITVENTLVVNKLDEVLTAINAQPQIEGLSPLPLCENGVITGYIAFSVNEVTGARTEYYWNTNLAITLVRPNGTLCDEDNVVDTIKQCLVDDVNGDGTNLVPFVRYVSLKVDGTTEVIADYNSTLTGPYVAVNAVDPGTLGLPASGRSGRVEVNGVWSPTSLMKSYTIRATSASSYTDSNNITTPIITGEVVTWSFDNQGVDLIDNSPVFNGEAVITYTFWG